MKWAHYNFLRPITIWNSPLDCCGCQLGGLGSLWGDDNWALVMWMTIPKNEGARQTARIRLGMELFRSSLVQKGLCQVCRVILCMRPANERWRYSVMPSLIGWVHTQNDPWVCYDTDFDISVDDGAVLWMCNTLALGTDKYEYCLSS